MNPAAAADDDDDQACIIDVLSEYVFLEGETFRSYELLEERLQKHSDADFVHYWRRDTRTVEGALTKTSRPIALRLKYYSLRYACVHGGQKFAKRGQGQRSKQSMRSDCPAYILIRASKCGQMLEVISVCNQHNHPISETESQTLPQHRRLPAELRIEVLQMMYLHIDRKKIVEYIRHKTGKLLKNKDLFNLRASYSKTDQRIVAVTEDTKRELLQRIKSSAAQDNQTKRMGDELDSQQSIDQMVSEVFMNSGEENYKMTSSCDQYQVCDSTMPVECLDPDGLVQVVEETVVQSEPYDQLDGFTIDFGDQFVSDGNYLDHDLSAVAEEPLQLKHDDEYEVDVEPSPGEELTQAKLYEFFVDDSLPDPPLLCPPSPSPPPRRRPPTRRLACKDFAQLRAKQLRIKATNVRHCKHCGLNAKLVRMQIDVLQAEKNKLIEETHILRLTKERLMLQTGITSVDDDDHLV